MGPVDEDANTIRRHPREVVPGETLEQALNRHDIAIGYRTTALVTAALMGLRIECRDDRSILARPDWVNLLPWADWHHSEIASGECWAHLAQQISED